MPRLVEFERAIQQSRRILLVLSPDYLVDGFTQFLHILAQTHGLVQATWPVIPLILRSTPLPNRIRILNTLDASNPVDWGPVIDRLCRELHKPVPAPALRPVCPYPGMVPFTDANAHLFFGRQREINDLQMRLRYHTEVFVIGPSGSGKSSLVIAGLVPALQQAQPDRWCITIMRPGSAPLAMLNQMLGTASSADDADGQRVAALLAQSPTAQRLLLVIDQFEELFVQAPRTDQALFFARLRRLAQHPQCAIIATLRADFYTDLINSVRWPVDPSQRIDLPPLRGPALRAAIEQPATAAGVAIEAGLLERLLADAADEPGVLPLLQETMALLWERMQRRLIPSHIYEQLGGDGRSGLAFAIAATADAALAVLSAPQQALARRILLRLIQFGEGRADTRRTQHVGDLRASGDDAQAFDATLKHLTDRRLLTLSSTLSIIIEADWQPTIRVWQRNAVLNTVPVGPCIICMSVCNLTYK